MADMTRTDRLARAWLALANAYPWPPSELTQIPESILLAIDAAFNPEPVVDVGTPISFSPGYRTEYRNARVTVTHEPPTVNPSMPYLRRPL